MAPRRCPSKKGQTRMDAALDAMSPFGFPNKLVRQTVHQLLKVYGGNEGWLFIEDSAYTLLIDTLLQTQSISSPNSQDGLIEDNPGGDDLYGASPAGCSNRALLPCSNTETSDDAPLVNQAVDIVSAASETGNQLLNKAVDTASATSEIDNELPIKHVDILSTTSEPGNQLPIKTVDTVSAITENGNQVTIKASDTVSADNESDCQSARKLSLGENGITPPQSSRRKSSQLVGSLCHKRRRPCHGWISDDDEEEELIELPPAPLSKVS